MILLHLTLRKTLVGVALLFSQITHTDRPGPGWFVVYIWKGSSPFAGVLLMSTA